MFDRIRDEPSIEAHWSALARHLRNIGDEDLAAVVRVFWRMIRECMFGPWNMTIEQALDHIRARHLARLAARAHAAEERELADMDE
jgi:hypothetical protein